MIYDKKINKILILKRSNYKNNGTENLWDFTGGSIEFGEDVNNSIRREAIEEIKLEIKETLVIKVKSGINKSNNQFIFILFYCDNFNLIENKIKLSNEYIEFKWINVNELKDYDLIYSIKHSVKDIEKYLKI